MLAAPVVAPPDAAHFEEAAQSTLQSQSQSQSQSTSPTLSETRDSIIFETSFMNSTGTSIVHLPDNTNKVDDAEVKNNEARITLFEENAQVDRGNEDGEDDEGDESADGSDCADGSEDVEEEESDDVDITEDVYKEGSEEDDSDDLVEPEMQLEHVTQLLEVCQKQLELLQLPKMRVQIDYRRLEVLQAQESTEKGMHDISDEMKNNPVSSADATFPPAFVRTDGFDGSTATLVNGDQDLAHKSAPYHPYTKVEEASDASAANDRDLEIHSAPGRKLAIREMQEFNETRLPEIEDFTLALENKRQELDNMRVGLKEMRAAYMNTEDQLVQSTEVQAKTELLPDNNQETNDESKKTEPGELDTIDGDQNVENGAEYRNQLVEAQKALEELRGQKEREQLEQEEVLGQLLEQLRALHALRMSLGSAASTDRKEKAKMEEISPLTDSPAHLKKEVNTVSNDSIRTSAGCKASSSKDSKFAETPREDVDGLLSRLTAVSVPKPEPNADADEDELMEVYAQHDQIQQDLSDRLKKIYDAEWTASQNDAPAKRRAWEVENPETAKQNKDEKQEQVPNNGIRSRLEEAIQHIFDHICIVKELLDQDQKAVSESKDHPGRGGIAMMEVSRLTNLWENLDVQLGELLKVQANFNYLNGMVDEKHRGTKSVRSAVQPLEKLDESTVGGTFGYKPHSSAHLPGQIRVSLYGSANPSKQGNESVEHMNREGPEATGVDFGTETMAENETASKPLPPATASVLESNVDMSGVYEQYRSRIIASANSVMGTHGESDPFFLAQVLRLLGPLGGPWDAAKRQRVLFALQDVIDEGMNSKHHNVPDHIDEISIARERSKTSQRKIVEEFISGARWRSPAVVATSKAALRADRFVAGSASARMRAPAQRDADEDEELEDWLVALRKKGRRNAKSAEEGESLFDVPSAYGLMHGGESELNTTGDGERDANEVRFWGQESPDLNRSSVWKYRDGANGNSGKTTIVKSKNLDRDSLAWGSTSGIDKSTLYIQPPGSGRNEKPWIPAPVPPAVEDSHTYGKADKSTFQSADSSMLTDATLRGKQYRPLGRMSSTSTFENIVRDEHASLVAGINSEDDADADYHLMRDRHMGKWRKAKASSDLAIENVCRVPLTKQGELQELPRSASSMSTVARYGSDEYPLLKRRVMSLPKHDWSNAGKGSVVEVVDARDVEEEDEMGEGEWGRWVGITAKRHGVKVAESGQSSW